MNDPPPLGIGKRPEVEPIPSRVRENHGGKTSHSRRSDDHDPYHDLCHDHVHGLGHGLDPTNGLDDDHDHDLYHDLCHGLP